MYNDILWWDDLKRKLMLTSKQDDGHFLLLEVKKNGTEA